MKGPAVKAENAHHRLRHRFRGAVAAARRPVSQWSRRTTAAATGVTALLAAGAAAALVATGATAAHPKPTVAASDAALSTNSGLHAIFKLHPDLGRPVSDLIRQDKLPAPTYTGDRGRVGVPQHVHLPAGSSTQDTAAASYIPGSSSGSLNPLQLASLALRAGCSPSEAPIAAAIASAESGGNPGAQGDITLMDSTWDWSEGLWQIRGLRDERGSGQLRDSLANANPVTNADAMYVISNGCTDWTPWTTYNTGAYLAYLPVMKSAVSSAVGYQVKTGAFPPVTVAGGPASVPSPGGPAARGAHGATKHGARSANKHRKHHRSRPHGPSSSGQPTAPGPKRTSAKPTPKPSPSSTHKKHHLPLPTKLPTTKLPKPTLPSLPTSSLPSLPTSGIPTLPSLP
jgi:hypothetical protein